MIGKRAFYIAAWIFFAVMLGNAGYRSLRPGYQELSKYPHMSFEDRLEEYQALAKETNKPVYKIERYFEMLYRFERLQLATEQARMTLDATTRGSVFPNNTAFDAMAVINLQGTYTNAMLLRFRPSDEFNRIRNSSMYAKMYEDLTGIRRSQPMDPATPRAWLAVYLAIILLQFGHFVIRLDEMGGSWMLALTDIRFYFWGLVPGGATKYPTKIDVIAGVKRAYRFAIAILGASLSLAAAGCAGKRVKTDPDEGRPTSAPIAWHANVDTTVWPTYVGADGAVFHNAPVVQSSATASHQSGFYTGVWVSDPLTSTNFSPNFARELDGSVGWAGRLLRGFAGSVDFTWVGVTPIAKYAGDVLQLTAGVSHDVKLRGHSVTPYFNWRHATPSRGDSPGSGTFTMTGVKTGWKLGRLDGGVRAEVMTDSGAFGFARRTLLNGGGSIGIGIGKGLRAEAPLRWYIPVTGPPDGRKPEFQLGARLLWQH